MFHVEQKKRVDLMEQYFKDMPSLPSEIDIPDLNHNSVDPVVKIVKSVPWYTPGTLEVSEEDFE